MMLSVKQAEKKFPIANCAYCLKKRVFMVSLPCQHSFCAQCSLNLIKITKIKKGLKNAFNVNIGDDDEEPLKCPKCDILHLISKEERD